jgi:ABC-type uncharacterized transport system permease subunit
MGDSSGVWANVLFAMLGGAIRVSTPFLFVSLGECLTELSGRVNLGLEGTLVMGAMSGYGVSLASGSPWLGVCAAGLTGTVLGALHAGLCSLKRVNDIAVGIALMVFGTGLAFFLGKSLIEPRAAMLPVLHLCDGCAVPQLRYALQINPLFVIGIVLAFALRWGLANTRPGLVLRTVGDSDEAARAMGYSPLRVRLLATMLGGFLAGVGGSFLSLSYPGSWNEGLSSGQGLIAVALVIFARWNPVNCLLASLLFGAAGALGPALQSAGISGVTYFANAAPYALTLIIMVMTSSPRRTLSGAPGELSVTR